MIESPFTIDKDLCALLSTMRLDKSKEESFDVQDETMSVGTRYHVVGPSEWPVRKEYVQEREMHGCAYLQTLAYQLENLQTTGGEYLEAIFTHREILHAHPGSHRECSQGFTELAYALEQRAWRADRDADTEAVAAFRNEAWVIANSFSFRTPPPPPMTRSTTLPCTMLPML